MKTSLLLSFFLLVNVSATCQYFDFSAGYTFRNKPSSIISGDFDGNGWQDIAFTTENSPYIFLIYHEINGQYSAITSVLSALKTDGDQYFLRIASGDFNEDGLDDIAAIDYYANSCERLFVHRSKGKTFEDPTVYDIDYTKKTKTINVADFDKDGHLDLIVGFSTNDIALEYIGKGDGTFEVFKSGIQGTIEILCVDDLTRDGKQDIVYSTSNNTLALQQGFGNFAFYLVNETTIDFPVMSAITTGNFLGLGPMIATAYFKNSFRSDPSFISFWDNKLLGATSQGLTYIEFFESNYFVYPACAKLDFNFDNKPDLLFSGSNGEKTSIVLWESKGIFNQDNSFNHHEEIIYRTAPVVDIIASKSNNKPWDAILIHAGSEIMIHSIDENANFTKTFQLPIGLAPSEGKVADLNNDNLPDLIVGNAKNHTIAILYNKGNKEFEDPLFIQTKEEVKKIITSDVNEDGFLDVVFTTYNSNIYHEDQEVGVILSNAGLLTGRYSYTLSSPATTICVADFNNDGHKDILSPEGFFAGSGSGNFVESDMSLNAAIQDLEASDIDQDGNMDYVYLTNQEIGIVYGMGNGTFSATTNNFPIDVQNPFDTKIFLTDTNNDGLPDIYVPGPVSKKIFRCLNLANRNFNFDTLPVNFNVNNLAFADFDNDSKIDMATAGGTAKIQMYSGNGDHTFTTAQNSTLYSVPVAIETGDINQDGMSDIVSFNSDGPNVNFVYGRATPPPPKPIIEPPPAAHCTTEEPKPTCKISCTCEDIFFPNVFTPNAEDSINTTFTAVWTSSITSAEIQIYDRWGTKIFNGDMKGWDGTTNNQEAETGIYYWHASYVCEKNQKKEVFTKKGYVRLIR